MINSLFGLYRIGTLSFPCDQSYLNSIRSKAVGSVVHVNERGSEVEITSECLICARPKSYFKYLQRLKSVLFIGGNSILPLLGKQTILGHMIIRSIPEEQAMVSTKFTNGVNLSLRVSQLWAYFQCNITQNLHIKPSKCSKWNNQNLFCPHSVFLNLKCILMGRLLISHNVAAKLENAQSWDGQRVEPRNIAAQHFHYCKIGF